MNRHTLALPVLLLALAAGIAGCGKDEPADTPREKSFGAGVGESYNQMLDEARSSADAANRHAQDVEQGVRDAQ